MRGIHLRLALADVTRQFDIQVRFETIPLFICSFPSSCPRWIKISEHLQSIEISSYFASSLHAAQSCSHLVTSFAGRIQIDV